jgi:hypothetical protein
MKNTKEWIRLLLPPAIAAFVGVITESQFVESLATLGGIVTLVPILVEWVKQKYSLSGKKWLFGWSASKWVSWGLAIGLIYLSWAVGFGFETMTWIKAGVYGIGAGLVSNGYFTLEQVQFFLAIVFGRQDKIDKINAINAIKNN